MTRVGFVGAGVMAEAIISGMLKSGYDRENIWCSDPVESRLEHMKTGYGINVMGNNRDLAEGCDVLVLAVKPQNFQNVVRELKPCIKSSHKLISIMAGVSTSQIEHDLRYFSDGEIVVLPVVRVMPNTPAMACAGVTCMTPGSKANAEDLAFARSMFKTVGEVADIDEALMDAATGISGCGPAYIYMIIEAMADGGVMMGMSRQMAQKLAAETVRGAAQMVLSGFGHPGELKDKVCSPAGATIAGVYALEQAGLRGAVMEAVIEGTEKSKRL